jgi:hypothetical protein
MPRRKNKKLREKTKRQADTFGDYDFDIPYLNTEGIILYRPPEPEPGKKRTIASLDFLMYEVTQNHNPMEDPGEIWYERTFYVHTNVGPDEIKVICPKRTFNKRCPICEYQASLKKKKGDHKEEIKSLYPRQRQLFVLIDADDKDEKIQVWDVSTYLFGELLMEEISEDEDLSVFADLEEGLTVKVKFKQESIGATVKFMKAAELDFTERDPFDDSIIDECPDLDSLLVDMEFEELEELFFCVPQGSDDDEEEEDEEEEEEEEKPSRRRRRRKPAEEPEEEEESEDEEEDDEESEAPSRRKRRNRRTTSRRATKEEPEEDEDEEDEKPKRRSRRRKQVEEEEEEEETPKPTKKKRSRRVTEEEDDDEDLECPYGGVFGKENGEYEECEECEVYKDCYKASRKR